MQRIRLFGYSIGQIDEKILQEYIHQHICRDLNTLIRKTIEEKILFRPVQCVEDLKEAEKLVFNLRFRNIGEYISYIMRIDITGNLHVCENCKLYNPKDHTCAESHKNKLPLSAWCENGLLKS